MAFNIEKMKHAAFIQLGGAIFLTVLILGWTAASVLTVMALQLIGMTKICIM